MEFRNLGASGLRVSAISYGNWLTHGSQVEEDAALACVRQALEEGITTFDTADVYANTAAETVLGKALAGERREGLEIFTKVFWPTGPGAHNDHGLSRKHILESIDGSLQRLQTDYVDLYQAHRYDHETPLEETMLAFADVVRAGKALYIGVSEWRAEEIRAAARAGPRAARAAGLQPAAVQPALARHRVRGRPDLRGARPRPGRLVADRAGRAHRQVQARAPTVPAGSRATDEKGGADMIKRWLKDDVLERVQRLQPIADDAGLSMAQLAVAWTLQNPNVSSAIIGASRPEQVTDNVKAAGVKLDADVLAAIDEVVGDVVERDAAKTQSPRRSEIFGRGARTESAGRTAAATRERRPLERRAPAVTASFLGRARRSAASVPDLTRSRHAVARSRVRSTPCDRAVSGRCSGSSWPILHLRLGQPHELHLHRAGDRVVGRALERLVGEARGELLAQPQPQHAPGRRPAPGTAG